MSDKTKKALAKQTIPNFYKLLHEAERTPELPLATPAQETADAPPEHKRTDRPIRPSPKIP